jgi:hypothetical protein
MNGGNNLLDGILPTKETVLQDEKSGLLASMLLESKKSDNLTTTTTQLVNGTVNNVNNVVINVNHELQYKKMNGGGKRPASTEPSAEDNGVKTAKLDLNGGGGENTTMLTSSKNPQEIIPPEGMYL